MNIDNINNLTVPAGITVTCLRKHGKASELYAEVNIAFDDEAINTTIPYYYRRTGLFIETEVDLAEYLISIKDFFSDDAKNRFVIDCKKYSELKLKKKTKTKPFFDKLLNLKWNSVEYDLPSNPNWARRIQDIKELGFTLATHTKMRVEGQEKNGTHILLLPIPKGRETGYEVFSKKFKAKAINTLGSKNEYDLSGGDSARLIPDHKFPEIRWDFETREENPDDMPDEEIITKFQLLDNQRNLQKREVCRNCFQTGKRGTLFGIEYFYEGGPLWNQAIPKTGKEAEKGCLGCGWYDIRAWRDSLNEKLKCKND